MVSDDDEALDDLLGCMVGSYRVLQRLGSGGMGTVYRAEHPAIGTQVAIKVLLPSVAASNDIVERFVREARASSAIGSAHIPRYYDFGRLSDGRAFAVMEYLEGESLAERLHRCGPMKVGEGAALLLQVAGALAEAHAIGIVHRDIKPENIFLAYDKRGIESVKVLDFGIAKIAASEGAATLTQQGFFVGSPVYCAPEQILGHAIGPATDVYTLGATAFEMLTGRAPFEGDLSDIFAAKARPYAPSARAIDPSLPMAVEATLARALACQAGDRFASMEELGQSIAGWLHAKPVRKPRGLFVAAIVGALLAMVSASGALAAILAPETTVPTRAAAPPPALPNAITERVDTLRSVAIPPEPTRALEKVPAPPRAEAVTIPPPAAVRERGSPRRRFASTERSEAERGVARNRGVWGGGPPRSIVRRARPQLVPTAPLAPPRPRPIIADPFAE